MTIVAQISVEDESTSLDQILADTDEDDLVLRESTDHSAHDQQTVEIRTDDKNALRRFHEECTNRGITLAVQRIYHEPDETSHSASDQTTHAI